ncbi:hypothetical protein CL634_05745 [bacterium]|nr:hypothetical protein [bacterium]
MFEKLKSLLLKFINILVILISLSCVGGLFFIGSILVTSIANAWRLTGYLDLRFGISVVLVYFILVWLPIWLITRFRNLS